MSRRNRYVTSPVMRILQGNGPASLQPPWQPAGLGVRAVSFVLDIIVLASSFMAFLVVAGLQVLLRTGWGSTDSGAAIDAAIFIVLGWLAFVPLYHIALWAWRGQTVGQMAVRVKVVRQDGRPLGLGVALVRFIGYVIALAFPVLGYLPALVDRRRRGLPDLLAGTMVVDLS